MATITIQRMAVRTALHAESTNVSRTYIRKDGVSDFEDIVIDKQADDSLNGAWNEACAKLREKMHEFLTGSNINTSMAQFDFMATSVPDGVEDNIKMYIVDWMIGDWLSAVRPDFSKRYYDRAAMQMDDLLRKLYKKEAPV